MIQSKHKLIMLSGLPASGKSTLAEKLQCIYPDSIRVNKDLISKMLHFGEYDWKKRAEVIRVEHDITLVALVRGDTVIVDDTNLREGDEFKWKKMADEVGVEFVKIDVDTPWQVCVYRDALRKESVGREVIVNFALEKDLVDGKFIICDLDGTLCDIKHRLHFVKGVEKKDWKGFFNALSEDTPRKNVSSALIWAFNRGYSIIYVSGRPEEYKQQTIDWLKKHNLYFNLSLIMRRKGDKRDDVTVKREILNKYFKDKSKIFMAIDDRPRLVRMWKEELGDYKVEDVGDGIEF